MDPPASLLTLPTELLDRIAAHLDWDRAASLLPDRPSLFALSLTTRHLRAATLPLLFRHVTLALHWDNGVLLTPALYNLCRERPDLARHIRAVVVRSRVGYPVGTRAGDGPAEFRVPDDVDTWLDLGESGRGGDEGGEGRWLGEVGAAHRGRVEGAVDALWDEVIGVREVVVEAAVGDAPLLASGSSDSDFPPASPDSMHAVDSDAMDVPAQSAEARVRALISSINAQRTHLQRRQITHRRGDNSDEDVSGPHSPPTINGPSTLTMKSPPGSSLAAKTHDLQHLQRHKLALDALATLMLCLPATLTDLVFEEPSHGQEQQPWCRFAHHLFAITARVFGPQRLRSLTMATSSFTGGGGAAAAQRRILRSRLIPSASILAPGVNAEDATPQSAHQLTALKRLVLANAASPPENINRHNAHPPATLLAPWDTPVLHTHLTHLELWNLSLTDDDVAPLATFLSHFTALRSLLVKQPCYATAGVPSRIYPHATSNNALLGAPVLLTLALALRRALPGTTDLTLDNPTYALLRQPPAPLPPSAQTWLAAHATRSDAPPIDFQREERLAEDFESFLPLWEAEDGARGAAAGEWRRALGGELADRAMGARGRVFENVRRDGGVIYPL
ncbi:hypothetical protein LTR53_010205 [Teratosphaeriaceae sp. CCFEE 6253]|nr:hypothetical protein LTR53_010205 [Teratosphaeriaceae sp. CCFEE 6253]